MRMARPLTSIWFALRKLRPHHEFGGLSMAHTEGAGRWKVVFSPVSELTATPSRFPLRPHYAHPFAKQVAAVRLTAGDLATSSANGLLAATENPNGS